MTYSPDTACRSHPLCQLFLGEYGVVWVVGERRKRLAVRNKQEQKRWAATVGTRTRTKTPSDVMQSSLT